MRFPRGNQGLGNADSSGTREIQLDGHALLKKLFEECFRVVSSHKNIPQIKSLTLARFVTGVESPISLNRTK